MYFPLLKKSHKQPLVPQRQLKTFTKFAQFAKQIRDSTESDGKASISLKISDIWLNASFLSRQKILAISIKKQENCWQSKDLSSGQFICESMLQENNEKQAKILA